MDKDAGYIDDEDRLKVVMYFSFKTQHEYESMRVFLYL
ncbi:MAG: hypothetical protein K0S61_3236 [Anaerocolumna sp.]|jgi:hypothetical protein|nr:hypothetical protein [Anaerocolumna sp.]